MSGNLRIAIALRTARSALGLSQDDLATKLGVAKSTIARVETLEHSIKGNTLLEAVNIMKLLGVDMNISPNEIVIKIGEKGIAEAGDRLKQDTLRRIEMRKSGEETRKSRRARERQWAADKLLENEDNK